MDDLEMTEDSFHIRQSLYPKHPKAKHQTNYMDERTLNEDFTISVVATNSEINRYLEGGNDENTTTFERSHMDIERKSSYMQDLYSSKSKIDRLYVQFFEIMQTHSNDTEVFDAIQALIQTISDVLEEVKKTERRVNDSRRFTEYMWLIEERNTWKLFHHLYRDRIMVKKGESECDMLSLGASEKDVINHLYTTNASLREYQLVVDWLEMCSIEQNNLRIDHFAERTFAWENTLKQLRHPESTVFGGNRAIVKNLDPDAPKRENRPLHDLDMEDEARLAKYIFLEIRQGRLGEAQELCERCGQAWRAALLEGWKLYEDPNFETGLVNEKVPIEGNPHRDIWKKYAWMMADDQKYDEYTRATAGIFCGHIESLLVPLSNSWEDLLWAYLKTQIDIRVEHEIRSCCVKNYLPMPEKYWNGKMSLEQIFDELSAHKNDVVRNAANNYMNVIQKYIILDDVAELMRKIQSWIEDNKLSPQMLRFLSHIVLLLKQIGKQYQEEIADKILKAYVEHLIELGDSQLVSYYTAVLPTDLQVELFSQYLETVKDSQTRGAVLEEAVAAGLDINKITSYTVETIRFRQRPMQSEEQLQGDISPSDSEKVSALEWLTFYPHQRGELLWQANALIRSFLGEGKIECVRLAINMVPPDFVTQIFSTYGSKEYVPYKEECCMKEFLCHKTYLDAIDGYNIWTRLFHSPPKEKATEQHKDYNFRAENARWERDLAEQYRLTRDLLFNVLLFPDNGWLVDPEIIKEGNEEMCENRSVQMENLRKLCIPEVVVLLHKVLHLSGEYADCIQLSDVIASEQAQLYKVYSPRKLQEFLSKVVESSVAAMGKDCDAWGYPNIN